MGRLIPLLALANLALLIFALIDCLSVEEYEIRALPRYAWVLIILLFSPVGPIAWFIAGRPAREPRPAAGSLLYPSPSRTLAPDDDPEFLRQMTRNRKEDEDMLRLWEADLRKREEELRRQKERDDPPTD